MFIPNFSRVFQVTIKKYGSEREDEILKVVADGVEEAIHLGYNYIDFLEEDDVLCYEVTSAQLWYDVYLGELEDYSVDEVEEVELVPAHPPYEEEERSI